MNKAPVPASPKISILLLGTQMATGGAQKVLLDQARWFHEGGHKVIAAFLYDKEQLHQRWQEASDFPIINLNAFRPEAALPANIFSFLSGLRSLLRLFHREKFDVIETFTHDSNIAALPLAWIARVPVRIATHHGRIGSSPQTREIIHAWMINHNIANVLVAVSEMTRQKALEEGIKAERIQVIQNGISQISFDGMDRHKVRQEAGFAADEILLLSVGRLVYQKAQEHLVSAMPLVLKEFPRTRLLICGDGILRSQLESQIRDLNLSDSVILLGMRNDVAKFLMAADMFVLSSRSEGLPLAMLEAMMAGLPVVATRAEGIEEVILEREQGLLVPVEDFAALAQAILKLLREPELRRSMGMAGKKRAQEFYSIDRMGEKYLALMQDCLRSSQAHNRFHETSN